MICLLRRFVLFQLSVVLSAPLTDWHVKPKPFNLLVEMVPRISQTGAINVFEYMSEAKN